jgi:hypothetical protein
MMSEALWDGVQGEGNTAVLFPEAMNSYHEYGNVSKLLCGLQICTLRDKRINDFILIIL